MANNKNAKSTKAPKPPQKIIVKKPFRPDTVQRLEISTWRSEVQQNSRTEGTSWTSSFFMTGVPADKSSQVTSCRLDFFSDDRVTKPTYSDNEIRIYYPYTAFQAVLELILHAKKLYAEFREKSNGEIDSFIFNGEQIPGGKKNKK